MGVTGQGQSVQAGPLVLLHGPAGERYFFTDCYFPPRWKEKTAQPRKQSAPDPTSMPLSPGRRKENLLRGSYRKSLHSPVL